MEFNLLPQIIIVISLGIIIIIMGKNIPKIKDLNEDNLFSEKKEDGKEKEKFIYLYSRIKKRLSRERYQRKVNSMWVLIEKILRKIRISFLKIDNKITSLLEKLRKKNIKIELDKNAEIDNINEYKDLEKEEVKEAEIDKKEEVGIEGNIQKSEVSKNINTDEIAKTDNEDEQDKMINDISEKEDAKGREREYIDKILKNPIDIKSYWNLGIVYSRRKNYKDAISCFRQITKIDPTYIKAKKKISDLMERMKDKKEDKKLKKENEKAEKEEANVQKEE